MIGRVGHLYALLLGWPALSRLHKAILYLSQRALGMRNHQSLDVSGERLALRTVLSPLASPVVFDVGANVGEWAAEVLRLAPGAQIHAFEPQRPLAEALAARYPDIRVNAVALGRTAGTLELHDYADHPGSQHASLLPGVIDGVHRGAERREPVQVDTLDAYCARHGIASIDLLKIDVEGFEYEVLAGARGLLDSGRVGAIQFEFNEMNMVARVFLSDFFPLLGPRYEIHRLLPHGRMKLHPQSIGFNEQFAYQNLLALRIQGPSAP